MLVWLAAGAGFAQTSDRASDTYLLRIQTVYRKESLCGLVGDGGQYHVERTLGDSSEISEGTLTVPAFKQLLDILNSNEVAHLVQDRITLFDPSGPKIYFFTPRDQVGLDIYRPDGKQTLLFPNDAVRQPFRHWLHPLLELLNSMRKERVPKLSEELFRNNCLPPAPLELKSRPGALRAERSPGEQKPAPSESAAANPTQKAEIATVRSPFVLRLVKRSYNDDGVSARKECVILYPDGRYRLEQFKQRYPWEPVNTEVFENTVSPLELNKAEKLIHEAALQKEQAEPPPEDFPYSVKESTVLTTVSGDRIRNLAFWRFRHARAPYGGQVSDIEKNGDDSLKSMREWFQTAIERQKGKPRRDDVPTDCIPMRK
jgi:hypothetical protein